MNLEIRAPRSDEELHDSLECEARTFRGGDWALPFFTAITVQDPWFKLENTRACFLDGKVVSAVQIFERPIRIGSCSIRMGGVGSVGTDPDHRRDGYSNAVLRDSVR